MDQSIFNFVHLINLRTILTSQLSMLKFYANNSLLTFHVENISKEISKEKKIPEKIEFAKISILQFSHLNNIITHMSMR